MRNPFAIALPALRMSLAAAALCALGCGPGDRLAGGGSDIGNGSSVAGLARTIDGLPARGALVRLRPAAYLSPLPAGAPKASAEGDTLADTRADSAGRFAFARILPGEYRIEVADTARGQGTIVACAVDSGGKPVALPESRLAATADLILRAPEGAAPGSAGYVRIPGLERLARVAAGESLRVEGLPAGEYVLDVASKDPAFAAWSGRKVSLRAGEATELDPDRVPCADRACDSLALAGFLAANGIAEPIGRFIKGTDRIDEVVLNELPFKYHFKTMAGLARLSALRVFKVEGPFLADSNMVPLFDALAKHDSLWLLSLSWSKDSGFTSLPPSIGKLRNLRHLYILGDSLKSVPAEIGQLTKLEFISMQFNQIAALPDWPGLTLLRELQVPHNELRALPAYLFNLPAMEKIDIADNRLCALNAAERAWIEARNGFGGPEGQRCP